MKLGSVIGSICVFYLLAACGNPAGTGDPADTDGGGISNENVSFQADANPLNFGEVLVDETSALKLVTVNYSGLAAGGFSLSVPTGFQLAEHDSSQFGSSLNYTASAESGSVTLDLRFRPTTAGGYAGQLTFTMGDTVAALALAGTGTQPPTVVFSPTSLNFGNWHPYAGPGAAQKVDMTSVNIPGSVTVSSYGGFGIAASESGTYGPSLNLMPVGGVLPASFWVRFDPSVTRFQGAQVSIAYGDASPYAIMQVSGTGIANNEGSVATPVEVAVGTAPYHAQIATGTVAVPSHSYYRFTTAEARTYTITVTRPTNWSPSIYVYANPDFATGVVIGSSYHTQSPSLAAATTYYVRISNTYEQAVFDLTIE